MFVADSLHFRNYHNKSKRASWRFDMDASLNPLSTCSWWIIRSSHRRCSVKKRVLENFAKFTEKKLRQSLFFNKIAGLSPATLFKKRLWYRCFPANFAKFLRTSFFWQNFSPLEDCLWIMLNFFFSNPSIQISTFKNFKKITPKIRFPGKSKLRYSALR